MLSFDHQARVELIREHPEVAPSLLRCLGLEVRQPDRIELSDPNFPSSAPTEYHADALPVLHGQGWELGIVVEVQMDRDDEKKRIWPFYEAACFKEHGQAVLLVIAGDDATADWAAQPIRKSPTGSTTIPCVVRPRDVPRIDSVAEALKEPGMAVLSALTHAPQSRSAPVVFAGLAALRSGVFSEQSERFFGDFIRSRMTEEGRERWRS